MNGPPPPGEPHPHSPDPPGEAESSLGGLLAEGARALEALLAAKARLARLELSRDLRNARTALALLGGAVAVLFLGLAFVGVGSALLLGDRLGSPGWAWITVAVVYFLGGSAALFLAGRRIQRLRNFLRESRVDLERDLEWLKKQL